MAALERRFPVHRPVVVVRTAAANIRLPGEERHLGWNWSEDLAALTTAAVELAVS